MLTHAVLTCSYLYLLTLTCTYLYLPVVLTCSTYLHLPVLTCTYLCLVIFGHMLKLVNIL